MEDPRRCFLEPLNCYHCSQFIVHPGIGCFKFFLKNVFSHGLSSLKYFVPLLVTPLVLKYKFMNRELFYNTIKHYGQTVFWSSLATASGFLLVCCFRNLFGKLYIYTSVFLPTALGMQFSWFFPPRVTKLFTTATTQATLEALLLQNPNKLTRLILHSTSVQTILFMLNSAIILHYKSKNIYKDFWFIDTIRKFKETRTKSTHEHEIENQTEVFKDTQITNCDHKNASCRTFVLDGMKSYFFIGIPLDLISMFMKTNLSKGPQNLMTKAKGKVTAFRPLMTAFFLSYVVIYRVSSCFLRKYYSDLSLDKQHLVSAFLGGSSFIFARRRNFLLLSMVISSQLLWQQFCSSISETKTGKKQNLILMILTNFRMSEIILSINAGYLAHNYLFNRHLVNNFSGAFLAGLTNNKFKNIRDQLCSHNMKTLIEMGKLYPVKIFI